MRASSVALSAALAMIGCGRIGFDGEREAGPNSAVADGAVPGGPSDDANRGGGACPTAPTPTWISGFEAGVLFNAAPGGTTSIGGGFTFVQNGSSGIVDAVSTPVRTGNYSMRIAPNSAAGNYAYLEAPWGV